MTNNPNIFELMEEVEKQKKAASLDDIYNMLDDVGNDTTTVVDVKAKVQASEPVNIQTTQRASTKVYKPSLPKTVTFDTRFECFKALIEGVDYGENNSPEYVAGHKKALESVYQDAFNNQKELYVVEARVSDEINRMTTKNTLELKGYYDGLFYALKTLRQSKTLSMDKVAKLLQENLK